MDCSSWADGVGGSSNGKQLLLGEPRSGGGDHTVTPQPLPQPLEDALEEIRSATSELILAASNENPASFLRSLTERGAAIERFQAIVMRARPRLTHGQLETLDEAARAVADQADEAHAVLAATMERARRKLEKFDKRADTVHGYAVTTGESKKTDRSR
jgi:hypothetical protein